MAPHYFAFFLFPVRMGRVFQSSPIGIANNCLERNEFDPVPGDAGLSVSITSGNMCLFSLTNGLLTTFQTQFLYIV